MSILKFIRGLVNNNIKSLIIGGGSIGLRHLSVLKELGHEIAIVTRRKDLNYLSFENSLDGLKIYKPNYIVIANDTDKHIKELKKILSSGYRNNIVVEKPISNDFNGLNLLPHETKKVFVGYNLRYHPFINFIKNLIIKEPILSANIYVGQYLPNWRPNRDYKLSYSSSKKRGGGVLLELSHEFDYMSFLFGKCLENFAISGKLSNLEIECNDSVVGISKFEHCEQISYNFNLLDKVGRREIIINTNDNTYKFDLTNSMIIKNDVTKKYSVTRNETYKDMHFDILNNDGKNACTYNESIDILNLINKIDPL
jgi:predicted dehydrogenase